MFTRWNDQEESALQGLPWLAQLLYLRGLRRFMDYATGIVGERRGISWQMLREVAYVESHPGRSNTGTPHKEAIRRAVQWLERAGLVEFRSDTQSKRLIFFLPLADWDSSASEQADTNPTQTRHTQPDTKPTLREPVAHKASSGSAKAQADTNPTHPQPPKADTPPGSGNRTPKDNRLSLGEAPQAAPARVARPLSGEPKPEPETAPRPRGTRLTLEALPPAWGDWARTERPDLDPTATWAQFRDYWIAQPGQKGVKTDWLATWRNWVRRERAERPGRSRPNAQEAVSDFLSGSETKTGTVLEGVFIRE